MQAQKEQCDDGNRRTGDGCDGRCRLELDTLHFGLTLAASLVLKGELYVWGSNRQGMHLHRVPEGGVHAAAEASVQRVDSLNVLLGGRQPRSIHGGQGHHIIVIAQDGTVWTAGLDHRGQLAGAPDGQYISCPPESLDYPTNSDEALAVKGFNGSLT